MQQTVLFKVLSVLLTLCSATASPTLAGEDMRLRILGQWTSTSADPPGLASLDEGSGVYIGVEKRVSPRWGVELGIGYAELDDHDVVVIDDFFFLITTEVETSLSWIPVTVAANYHLTPNRSADLYIGPRMGWAFADDLDVQADVLGIVEVDPRANSVARKTVFIPTPNEPPARSSAAVEDSMLFGARLGLDWPIGDGGWKLSGAIDYTVMTPDILRREVEINPLTVGVGLAHRW